MFNDLFRHKKLIRLLRPIEKSESRGAFYELLNRSLLALQMILCMAR
jgi:hypothetical protein